MFKKQMNWAYNQLILTFDKIIKNKTIK